MSIHFSNGEGNEYLPEFVAYSQQRKAFGVNRPHKAAHRTVGDIVLVSHSPGEFAESAAGHLFHPQIIDLPKFVDSVLIETIPDPANQRGNFACFRTTSVAIWVVVIKNQVCPEDSLSGSG